jgi:putative Mg2+ transporter-C (MgtC) family protein
MSLPFWLESLLRLGAAVIAGGAIGWERESRGRPAGLRTHMLVGLGSSLIVSAGASAGPGDLGRAIQGVATGVGFLCAGDILHVHRDGGERVKGLTSAAALWVTAALGIAAATARWALVLAGTIATVLTLTVARRLEVKRVPAPRVPDRS